MLQLFEKGRFDHDKANSDAPFVANPHEARLGLKPNITFRQQETDIEQSSETKRLFEPIQTHPAGAEIDPLDCNLFALRILDRDLGFHPRAEELLLVIADGADGSRLFTRSEVNAVFLELPAQSASRNTELLGR